MRVLKWLSALVALACAAPAAAQEESPFTFGLSEVRGGVTMSGLELIAGTGVILDPKTLEFGNIDSAQFDVLFRSPDLDVFRWIGSPRPTIGGVVNLRGRESLVHAGLTWQLPLGDVFYLEAGVGGGIHNGALSGAAPPLRNLGCRALYHWSYGVGAHVTDSLTITANLQHLSNVIAGCSPNDGLNHLGVSLGYKF